MSEPGNKPNTLRPRAVEPCFEVQVRLSPCSPERYKNTSRYCLLYCYYYAILILKGLVMLPGIDA